MIKFNNVLPSQNHTASVTGVVSSATFYLHTPDFDGAVLTKTITTVLSANGQITVTGSNSSLLFTFTDTELNTLTKDWYFYTIKVTIGSTVSFVDSPDYFALSN